MKHFDVQEINEEVARRKMIAEYDCLIKKYLQGNATQEERDKLLIFTLKNLNEALLREKIYRQTIARMAKEQDVTIIIDERYHNG